MVRIFQTETGWTFLWRFQGLTRWLHGTEHKWESAVVRFSPETGEGARLLVKGRCRTPTTLKGHGEPSTKRSHCCIAHEIASSSA